MSRGLLRRRSVSLEGSRVPQSPAPSHQNPGTLHSFQRHAKCLCKSASLHCHACTSLQVLLTKSMRPLNQAAQFERLKAAGGISTAVSLYTSLCLHARVSSPLLGGDASLPPHELTSFIVASRSLVVLSPPFDHECTSDTCPSLGTWLTNTR